MHRVGEVHGGISESAVGVGTDGWVRLSLDALGDKSRGPAGDIADTGALLCRLLGVDPYPAPHLPAAAAERAAPALVALGRKLARDTPQWTPEEVWVAVRDAGGFWGTEPRLVEALGALAERAEGATAVERAVARVFAGPPLRSEEPPEVGGAQASRLRPALPRLSLGRAVLPALPALSAAAAPPKPALPWLKLPARVPSSRLAKLGAAALAGGLLIGALAGVLGSAGGSARAAAAHRPAARRLPTRAPASAKPAGLFAETPTAAVSIFFQLVQQQQLDQAALLWKPKMAESVDLRSRFGGVGSIDLRKDDLLAEDDRLGVATVAVDWVETEADGSTHEYAGVIYTDTGPVLWRWDSWRVNEVVAPPPGGGGGGGDGGDGG